MFLFVICLRLVIQRVRFGEHTMGGEFGTAVRTEANPGIYTAGVLLVSEKVR